MDFKKYIKKLLLKTIWSFGPDELLELFLKLGVKHGDTIMVHSGWQSDSGFMGTPQQLVQTFIDAVGPEGTVCMMSMPFHNMTAEAYLKEDKVFNVKKTISMVGIPSEIFRRRKDVVRSLHPTHSVAAYGRNAEWIVSNHENCKSPFDEAGPFGKLVDIDAKIVMYGVPFSYMTFEHYLEHIIMSILPVPLYSKVIAGCVIDYNNNNICIPTLVLSEEINSARSTNKLFDALLDNGLLHSLTCGRVKITCVDSRLVTDYVRKECREKSIFHDY